MSESVLVIGFGVCIVIVAIYFTIRTEPTRKELIKVQIPFWKNCLRTAGYSHEEIAKIDFYSLDESELSKMIMDRVYEGKGVSE